MLIDLITIYIWIFIIGFFSILLTFSENYICFFSHFMTLSISIYGVSDVFYQGDSGYLWFALCLYIVILSMLYVNLIPGVVFKKPTFKFFTIEQAKSAATGSSGIGLWGIWMFAGVRNENDNQEGFILMTIVLLMFFSGLLIFFYFHYKQNEKRGKRKKWFGFIEKPEEALKEAGGLKEEESETNELIGMKLMVCPNCGSKITDDNFQYNTGFIIADCMYCGSKNSYE